jgi:hypothetical protein
MEQTVVAQALIDALKTLALDHRYTLDCAIDDAVANLEYVLQTLIELHGLEAVQAAILAAADGVDLVQETELPEDLGHVLNAMIQRAVVSR